ncbi:uncharacterized protein LY89DRAFT_474568 [Mollisia scopiformis]|uniref:Ribonucleases P/MRP subunit Pop8-like domain-containing protein n=1 Tax=Mollisia scopiformis TaxID=149040 RepID=A0A194XJC7_MOLSC|nr:uncharacterized protein LY89DRAFT_474568 [Mollisia scopiformis]KUJ20224.1 hypothetical protein LY89DRAFT_474568 [Mollisia scopiformis]
MHLSRSNVEKRESGSIKTKSNEQDLPFALRRSTVMETLPEDSAHKDTTSKTKVQSQHRGHEIASKTIKAPPFSYVCLQLVSDLSRPPELDLLSVRSYITAGLTQFLGLTGSAIAVDILKVDQRACWIRVPREDLSPVIAALGGWVGGTESEGRVSWKVKAAGNWLGALVAQADCQDVWNE